MTFRVITPHPGAEVPSGAAYFRVCGIRGSVQCVAARLVQVSPPTTPAETIYPLLYRCNGTTFDFVFRGLREGSEYRLEFMDESGGPLPPTTGLHAVASSSAGPIGLASTSLTIDAPDSNAQFCPDTEPIPCQGQRPVGQMVTAQLTNGSNTVVPTSDGVVDTFWFASFPPVSAGTWTIEVSSGGSDVSRDISVVSHVGCQGVGV